MRDISTLEKKEGTALVLSGGATKAFYFHLGVLKALRHEPITSIVGSSAGAIVGSFLAYGATVDDLITALYQQEVYLPRFDAWVKTMTSDMLFKPRVQAIGKQSFFTGLTGLRFVSSLPMMRGRDVLAEALDRIIESQTQVNSFFDARALEDLFKSLLPSTRFEDADIDLYVVATALDTRLRAIFNGRYDFQDDGPNAFITDVPVTKAVRASSCVPGMFEPVKIKGRYYIDGEVKRTLSADIGASLANKVIISHTYQPIEVDGGISVRDMGWLNVLKQATLMVFHERIAIWRQLYEERNPDTELIWIQPDADDVDFFLAPEFSFRPETQKMLIQRGEEAALKALSGIKT